ncbi:amino acid permease [Rhodococcus sp. ACT016]|uniref:amino acid permease n=1 Tax=Rhodococcus sp. ACT016 TaxID=3134808 RepID=UPI003D2661CE
MTATVTTASSDRGDLAEFGYEQQLHRSLGKFGSFAAGFSFVSILTTIFQLFGLGFGFAGPAFFWTWPVVFLGQFIVALCFAELAARYPISGAIYQWSRRLGGEIVGWFAGWFMIIAQIVTAAAAAIALQVVLPSIWGGFQVIGDDSALTSPSGAANAVLLGSVLLVSTTTINCIGVNWMSRINSIGVTCEIVGVVAVIGMFFTHAQRGPDVVFDTGAAGSQPGYIWAWGLPYVLTSILSSPWGTVLLVDVAIAVFVCTLAIQTAASRLMFSMARDGRLPASDVLSKVNRRTGTPIAPSVLIGLLCIGVLAVNVGNSAIFATLSSVCIVLIYLAYLMVTVPLLVRRLSGRPLGGPDVDAEGRELFSLGVFGIPVNVAAVAYGALMVVNLSWPRAEIFNPTGEYPILQWAAPLTVLAVVIAGAACYSSRAERVPNPVTIGA